MYTKTTHSALASRASGHPMDDQTLKNHTTAPKFWGIISENVNFAKIIESCQLNVTNMAFLIATMHLIFFSISKNILITVI